MHKDLSEAGRTVVENMAAAIALQMKISGQSLGVAREAMIAAFDNTAEELDAA